MVMQPERCIVLGGTWRTPVAMGLQSKTFIKDQQEEGTFNEASFEREFESRWSGTTEDAFFNPEAFARARVLNQPEYEASGRSSKLASYIIAVDVARFKGCDTVFCILKSTPQPQGVPIKTLVNMYTMNDEHFEDQAIFAKRLYFKYNANRIVIDGNGVKQLSVILQKYNIDKSFELLETVQVISSLIDKNIKRFNDYSFKEVKL